jgi:hypothetical protein
MCIACGVILALAAGAGFLAASGTSAARLNGAFIGAALGFFGLLLLAHVTRVVRGLRAKRRQVSNK